MSKFKIGDKVEVIDLGFGSKEFGVTVGMQGEVVIARNTCVGVLFDENIDGNGLWYEGVPTLTGDKSTKGLWMEPSCLELIETEQPEEPKMTQQFKAMKIRIKDAIHSRMVQEALFSMGYGWPDQVVRHTEYPWLTTYEDGRIYYGTSATDFNSHTNEEVELVTTYSIKPIDQEAKRKREEKEALEKGIAAMQKQLDEMKQKLEKM